MITSTQPTFQFYLCRFLLMAVKVSDVLEKDLSILFMQIPTRKQEIEELLRQAARLSILFMQIPLPRQLYVGHRAAEHFQFYLCRFTRLLIVGYVNSSQKLSILFMQILHGGLVDCSCYPEGVFQFYLCRFILISNGISWPAMSFAFQFYLCRFFTCSE